MTNQMPAVNTLNLPSVPAVVITGFLMLLLVLTPVAQATPMTVDVYGAPYFSLFGDPGKHDSDRTWMVLTPAQTIDIELTDEHATLSGRQDLSVRDRTGRTTQFGLLDMSLELPGTRKVPTGVIEYLMDDRVSSFTVHQVIDREPVLRANSALSLLFWGIDYSNGVGLILGLETALAANPISVAVTVAEPSLLMLLLTGLLGYGFSRVFNSKKRTLGSRV